MAGDKGAEVPKSTQEYLQRPKAVKDTLDYYRKPGSSNAFRSAISRAVDSLRRRGRQLPTNDTMKKFLENPSQKPADKVDPFYRRRDVRFPHTDLNLRANNQVMSEDPKQKYFGDDKEKGTDGSSEE